jgi:phospholipid/cholesterol/gamma-HCH transport system permease protein
MPQRWRLTGSYSVVQPARHPNVRQIVGRATLRAASHVGRVSFLVWQLILGLPEWRIWVPRAVEQGVHVGYGSLFIIVLTAGFAGGVTSLQAGYQFTAGIPVYFAAGVITQSIILELGPVLTALILAGRIGARYAAELGSMRVTEQIDALESLGRSSVSHLILPRVVAGTIMLPVLVIFADAIGVGAGWLAAKSSLDMSNADFIYGARYFFKPFDLWYSMIKSFAFGLAITIIPCYMGFSTKQGAEGVGRSTTAAVVSASVLILFLDVALAKILLQ